MSNGLVLNGSEAINPSTIRLRTKYGPNGESAPPLSAAAVRLLAASKNSQALGKLDSWQPKKDGTIADTVGSPLTLVTDAVLLDPQAFGMHMNFLRDMEKSLAKERVARDATSIVQLKSISEQVRGLCWTPLRLPEGGINLARLWT